MGTTNQLQVPLIDKALHCMDNRYLKWKRDCTSYRAAHLNKGGKVDTGWRYCLEKSVAVRVLSGRVKGWIGDLIMRATGWGL